MFDNRCSKDRPAYRKEQKKTLPYTVRDLGGANELAKWKAEREAKLAEDERKRNERFDGVVARLQAAMDTSSAIQQTDEVKAMIAVADHEADRAENAIRGHLNYDRNAKGAFETQSSLTLPPRWYHRLFNKLLNLFLNINFGD